MPQQMYQMITPQIADRCKPLTPKIHAAFASVSPAVSADGSYTHSTVALIAPPEHASQP